MKNIISIADDMQIISADIGRGYVKGFSIVDGEEKECCFKSIVGMGRRIDFKDYVDPIYIEVEGEDYFAGELAEKEADAPTQNSRDSKTSVTAQKLLYAAMSKMVVKDKVKIMLGVPNKLFKKSVLEEVIDTYKGKEIKIKDKITGGCKVITIVDISIFRESDAAAMYQVRNNRENLKPIGMVVIGFRTTEFSYFDIGLKFNDKKSKTIDPLGNKTALEYVQRILMNGKKEISKELSEIDSSNEYNDLKKRAYDGLSEKVAQEIENAWINLDEMDIYIGGGTSLNMNFDDEFTRVENPQMTTAKGLFFVAVRLFK